MVTRGGGVSSSSSSTATTTKENNNNNKDNNKDNKIKKTQNDIIVKENTKLLSNVSSSTTDVTVAIKNESITDINKKKSLSSPSKSKQQKQTDLLIWNEVSNVFQRAQSSSTSHSSGMLVLKKLMQSDYDKFLKAFQQCLDMMLLVFKREPTVERVIKFAVSFCGNVTEEQSINKEDNNSETLSIVIIKYLLQFSNAKEKSVRLRVCQIISRLLGDMQDFALDDDLWDSLESALLLRSKDKIPAVRVEAVKALERLQDPAEENDEVVQCYLRLLKGDSSKEVRKAVLQCIGISKYTLPEVIERTRDFREDVRACAYYQLEKRISIQYLSIAQRVELLEQGLKDRGNLGSAKKACEDMLCFGWLQTKLGDPIALLETLDVEGCEDLTILAVNAMLNKARTIKAKRESKNLDFEEMKEVLELNWETLIESPSISHCDVNAQDDDDDEEENDVVVYDDDESKLQPIKKTKSTSSTKTNSENDSLPPKLNSERVLFWRALFEDVKKRGDETEMDKVLPNLMKFSQILKVTLKEYSDAHEAMLQAVADPDAENVTVEGTIEIQRFESASFVLKHLLQVASKMDYRHDTVGRGKVLDIVLSLLTNDLGDEAVAKPAILCLRRIHGGDDNIVIQQITGLINAVEDRNPMYCLSLMRGLLEVTLKPPSRSAELDGLLSSLILPCVQNPDLAIRLEGVRCLGLFGLLEAKAAAIQLPILKTSVQTDDEDEEIRGIALKAICDFFTMYDPSDLIINQQENNNNNISAEELGKSMVEMILGFIQSPSKELRLVAVEGLAKISFVGKLRDPKILECLIALYFHPSSESDNKIRQCLSVFFPEFALIGTDNQRFILDMSIPLLLSLMQPQEQDSVLEQVPFESVVEYIVYLLAEPMSNNNAAIQEGGEEENVNQNDNNDESSKKKRESNNNKSSTLICFHELFGIELCLLLSTRSKSEDCARFLSKALNILELDTCSPDGLIELSELCKLLSKLRSITDDRLIRVQIEKFSSTIRNLIITKKIDDVVDSDKLKEIHLKFDKRRNELIEQNDDNDEISKASFSQSSSAIVNQEEDTEGVIPLVVGGGTKRQAAYLAKKKSALEAAKSKNNIPEVEEELVIEKITNTVIEQVDLDDDEPISIAVKKAKRKSRRMTLMSEHQRQIDAILGEDENDSILGDNDDNNELADEE